MIKKITNQSGISLIFAILVTTALTLTAFTLNEVIIRNIQRVGDIEAQAQAQAVANSAFEQALLYVSQNCSDAGCDYVETHVELTGPDQEVVGYAEFEIQGEAEQSSSDGNYYVPIPGEGDAITDEITCDAGNPDNECNWNRIYYGETVEIPLFTGGGLDTFGGSEFELKIRTPACEHDSSYCPNERYLISCEEDSVGLYFFDGCDYEDDPVVITWQIWGQCAGGNDCYAEANRLVNPGDQFTPESRSGSNSEIVATRINSTQIVLDIEEELYGTASDNFGNFLYDILDAAGMTNPVLKITLVEPIFTYANQELEAIPYLEYQVKTNAAISNNTSIITVTGYVESDGTTYYWQKEGSWTSFTSSPINFAFQN